jgi:hypothetical protein
MLPGYQVSVRTTSLPLLIRRRLFLASVYIQMALILPLRQGFVLLSFLHRSIEAGGVRVTGSDCLGFLILDIPQSV